VKLAPLLFSLGLALGCSAALAQAPGPGEVELKLPDGGLYIGTVTNGIPDGKGYFKDDDGMYYEGDVHMGHRTGVAEALFPDGDRYKGSWKDGKPDGVGMMSYMLGGSYEGEWKNGLRHGKGMMTFAGSGRRAEVRFEKDSRVDVTPDLPSSEAGSTTYSLWSGTAVPGSWLSYKIAYGSLPLDRGFDELTPDQQRLVRSYYPALDVGDDPPYPLNGGKELYTLAAKLADHLRVRDRVLIYVTVGADASVTSVAVITPFDPEVKRVIAAAAGRLKYKPARCGGQPCPGVAAFDLLLTFD